MKILGVAIARTILLNLAASTYLLDFSPPYPLLSVLISSLVLILAIAYVNQCIDWKRQSSRKLLNLVKLQKPSLMHGVEGFVILFLAALLPLLGVIFYEGIQTGSTNEMHQLSDTEEVGLIVIGAEILILVFYIFNERRKQKAAKNNQSHEPGMVKTVGVAIARTILLNLVLLFCSVPALAGLSPLLSALLLILIITYINRWIEWKRQGSHSPLALLNPRLPNLRHGIDAFAVFSVAGFIPSLGTFAYQAYLESITDGWTGEPEKYQFSDTEVGLVAIAVVTLEIFLYIMNERQKQQAAKKKLAKASREPLK